MERNPKELKRSDNTLSSTKERSTRFRLMMPKSPSRPCRTGTRLRPYLLPLLILGACPPQPRTRTILHHEACRILRLLSASGVYAYNDGDSNYLSNLLHKSD